MRLPVRMCIMPPDVNDRQDMKRFPRFITSRLFTPLVFLYSSLSYSQDSTVIVSKKVITLKEVVVRSNLNVAAFIDRVKNDTTFYKAFRNLRILGYTALNDV